MQSLQELRLEVGHNSGIEDQDVWFTLTQRLVKNAESFLM